MKQFSVLFVIFCGVVWVGFGASAAVVINEIHYNPDVSTEPAEFVELHNTGPATTNLAGWTLSDGKNFNFVLPSTNVAAGGYVVVAQNPTFLQTKFAVAGVLGPFQTNRVSALSKYGDKLTLRDGAGKLIDEVEYQLGFPWPTVGDSVVPGNGSSIELIHPSLDNNLAGSWRASVGTRPTPGRINSVFATNAPPQIRQVEHQPEQPSAGQPVKITARVTDLNGVASVLLEYQLVNPGSYIELSDPAYTNAANWLSVAMNDAGAAGDVAAGDALYTATIPGSVQTHRRLVRYRLTVADALGRSVRVPYADDPQPNFAYFVYNGVPEWRGAVQPGSAGSNGVAKTYSSNVMGRLPVFHLIGRSNTVATATWISRYAGDLYQWGGALVYDGKVYDHIRYRARGGVWRYSMCKNMWKFDLNRGHDLEVRDNWGRKFGVPWTKLNLGACIQQGDFNHRGEQGMFESTGFRFFNLAGVAAPLTSFCTFRVIDDAQEASPTSQFEGDFWGLYLAIEQENGRFLEQHDLPDGNFYKMEGGTGELNNLGPLGPTDKSDLSYLQANYNNASEQWWRTNWNVANHYSYQAIVQGIHHYDIADGKNYFFYRNPETRLWQTCTWDLDLTWADNMYRAGQTGGDEPLKSRLLDNYNNPGRLPNINVEYRNRVREIRDLLWNSDQAFKLIDEYAALLRGPTNLPSILDADRSMWDYNPKMVSATFTDQPSSKAGQGRFYQWPNEPTVAKSFNGGIQVLKNYVGYRSTNATFSLDTMAADAARPSRPALTYTGPTNHPLNRISLRTTAYAGSNPFKAMRWRMGEVTDVSSPGYNPGEPSKYEIESVWESGSILSFNADVTVPAETLRVGSRYRARVQFTDSTGRNSNWSAPYEFTCGEPADLDDLLNYLRITEVMFHPPPGGYEYIELYNSSSIRTLDLSGVHFSQGIDFTCLSGTTMPPGSYLLVAGTPDLAGFRAFYGLAPSVPVVGPFDGGLNNAGEQLTLRTAAGGSDIVEFNFSDGRGWPVAADGNGHSLVPLEAALAGQGTGAGEFSGNWRPSTYLRGSAGRADAVPSVSLLINEVVAHTDFEGEFDSNDWIELYNPTASPITLGPGWYLSDDASTYTNLMKWAIPAATTVSSHGFVTFDEVTGFHNPTNIGFGLNKGGEQVFLSYLPGPAQDRIVDAVGFKAQENEWSMGRYPDGGPFWYGLTPRSRNAPNTPPPARVAISEIMFHPPDTLIGTNALDDSLDEFIELCNGTGGPLSFHNTNGAWRLNGGVDFLFPTNLTLGADGYLLVVNFDPMTNAAQTAAFQSRYNVTNAPLVILGPYAGKLGNNSDRIALEKPQHGDGTNDPVSWVIIDEVIFSDQAPFPCGSDGTGNSLQRLDLVQHGSDPGNWRASPPTAGRPRENLPPGLPSFLVQPQNRIVPTNGNATFSVSLCGTPPFSYQWRFQGVPLDGATNATLDLINVSPGAAGDYDVIVSNPAGSILSLPGSLIVQFAPIIVNDPVPTTTVRDLDASFSVTAGGTPPFNYQWRFNGANLSGATNSLLFLSVVQASQAGAYSVLVNNNAGSVLSASATLTVRIPATITQQPTNRTVVVAATPTNVSFAVEAVGTGALVYQWRFDGADILGATSAQLTVTNVQIANGGDYSVKISDTIGSTTSSNATLTVLAIPVILQAPVSQTVPAGSLLNFSVVISGSPAPFGYQWRSNSLILPLIVSNARTNFFSITSAPNAASAIYRIIVTNAASQGNGVFAQCTVVTLADTDRDGLPDTTESALGLNPNDPMDAAGDLDDDGMSNLAEYIAGTDPANPLSYLKVEPLTTSWSSNFTSRIEFNAISNRTYTVQSSDGINSGSWTRVRDVVATSTNRAVILFDSQPTAVPLRAYRLVTPKLP